LSSFCPINLAVYATTLSLNFNIYTLWHNLVHIALRNTRIVKAKMQTQFWWGNLKKRDHIEDLGVDGRMILKLILKT